jgi:NAD(P)-dependent dehydrogenase (short-subunit alcohol dehydrogenase family)
VTTEQWDRMFAVHARGAFLCYKYAVRQMIKQGRGGRIVGACSLSGLRGKPNDAHYCAAKFAIRGLTQSVGTSLLSPGSENLRTSSAALEVGRHGITVNAYAPGLTMTPLSRDHFLTGNSSC